MAILEYGAGQALPPYVNELFNLERESSFATWFSAILLAMCGVLSLVCWSRDKEGDTGRYWRILGLALWVLSADEAVSLHERASLGIRLSGPLTFAWVIPATVAVAAVGSWFLFGFFPRLSRSLRVGLFVAAAVFVTGALGVEFVEGAVASGWLFGFFGEDSLAYQLTAVVQESLEMIGSVLFVSTLVNFLQDVDPPVRVTVI
jgi:hypothetical protein